MLCSTMSTSRCQQAWIRAVIFIGLYMMLLLSFTQCALILYLYGTAQVDGITTPSLIIALIASFLSVPFVVIHTILSWQYRKVPGLNMPRNALHMACSHLPRVMVAMWLAASVAGLVVVSKQATCLPASEAQQFWRAGMGCKVHRGTTVLSILAFCTTSALFFCFQVCERPYDASLLGLYAPQRPPRDGSIFSESSWESETLKNNTYYLCRHPNASLGNGELYWSPNDSSVFDTAVEPPTIRVPGPTRARPQLHISTHMNSVRPSIATSLTETSPKVSPIDDTAGSISLRSDVSPLSRNPSLTSTLQPGTEAAFTRPPMPKIPDIPEIPPQATHKRQKSSVSSRKFLPRDWDMSEPLSEDPQIRALASPPLSPDIEPEQQSVQTEKGKENPSTLPSPPPPARAATAKDSPRCSPSTTPSNHAQTRRRSMTAPGSPPPVPLPVPLAVRKSRTSHLNPTPRSIHHPHHPNYVPQGKPKSSADSLNRNGSQSLYNGGNEGNAHYVDNSRPLRQPSTTRLTQRHAGMGHGPGHPSQTSLSSHGSIMSREHSQKQRLRTSGSFTRNTQFIRYAGPQSNHYQRQHYYHHQPQHMVNSQPRHLHPNPPTRPAYVRRFHSNDGRGFDPAHTLPPIPRSDDTATLYPSTRRPRSSTYGGSPSNSNPYYQNDSREGDGEATERNTDTHYAAASARPLRTSLSLGEGGVALDADREIVDKKNTYRGAERTSIYGGL